MTKKIASKKFLGDKIMAKMSKPKNADYDIEDEDFNFNKSRNENEDEDDYNSTADEEKELEEFKKREHYVKVSKSKIRDNTVNLGEKYTGSKVGRNEIYENDDESSENDESDGSDDESENDESAEDEEHDGSDILIDVTDSEEELEEEEEEDDDDDDDDDIQSEESASEIANQESEDEEEAFKRSKIATLLESEKQQIINRLSTSAKSDALKGYTVLKQGSQYDNILDARIKLQKAILSSNQLPVNSQAFEKYQTKQTRSILESTEDKLYTLIEKLLRLRAEQLHKDGLIKNKIDSNPCKKRKLSDYLEQNKVINDALAPVTKSVLVKWSNRVQSASGVGALNNGKFKVINQNVWTQVNNQLGDLDRLIKKTKINRRNVIPIGYKEEENAKANNEDDDDHDIDSDDEAVKVAGLSNIDKSLQTNEYIFDDDDFYRLLLNDMINKKLDQKQANSSAVLMISKNKMQKNYDRMATKGRKLKYTAQEPIVQFEIPRRKYYSWNDDQIDELFAGLFGMQFNMADSDESEDESNNQEQNVEDINALRGSGVKLFG